MAERINEGAGGDPRMDEGDSAKDQHNNQAVLLKQWIENDELDLK